MKTKLLKKIRKRFTIEYYPLGLPNGSQKLDAKYLIKDKNTRLTHLGYDIQESIDLVIYLVRKEYYQYSRKYKQQNKPIKVWWNEK